MITSETVNPQKVRVIKVNNHYYELSDKMATKVGEFFGERHTTGEWEAYEVHDLNDTVHEGFKIVASTQKLPEVPLLISSFFFPTLGGQIGVEYPDEEDSVMGYYQDFSEAFDALVKWVTKKEIENGTMLELDFSAILPIQSNRN